MIVPVKSSSRRRQKTAAGHARGLGLAVDHVQLVFAERHGHLASAHVQVRRGHRVQFRACRQCAKVKTGILLPQFD